MKIFGKSVDEWITFDFVDTLAKLTVSAWVIWVIWLTNKEYSWLGLLF